MAYRLADMLHAVAYSTVALVSLVWVGNVLCRWLLHTTKLTAAMELKRASANQMAAQKAAQNPATKMSGPGEKPTATQPSPAEPSEPEVGAIIGAFERILLAVGVLSGSWEVMAGVVALKTIARFKELDERLDAEYFLVGSLFSILWAIAITVGWIAYDETFGLDIGSGLAEMLTKFKGAD